VPVALEGRIRAQIPVVEEHDFLLLNQRDEDLRVLRVMLLTLVPEALLIVVVLLVVGVGIAVLLAASGMIDGYEIRSGLMLLGLDGMPFALFDLAVVRRWCYVVVSSVFNGAALTSGLFLCRHDLVLFSPWTMETEPSPGRTSNPRLGPYPKEASPFGYGNARATAAKRRDANLMWCAAVTA
jgi:hypothetical protein